MRRSSNAALGALTARRWESRAPGLAVRAELTFLVADETHRQVRVSMTSVVLSSSVGANFIAMTRLIPFARTTAYPNQKVRRCQSSQRTDAISSF